MLLDVRWLGRMEYSESLRLQVETAALRRAGQVGDTLLLLEHEPVYTIGRTPDHKSLGRSAHLPHPVVEISRGGLATYHGPGQLVGYPVLDLAGYGRDLHRYLRALEGAVIEACRAVGVEARRRESLTGVWVGEKKLASIGVGVRHWISQHGFAVNVTRESLEGFRPIIPCGLDGVEMTCLEIEGGRAASVEAFAGPITHALRAALNSLAQC
jgi:lipoyl(octanoyl) transferase